MLNQLEVVKVLSGAVTNNYLGQVCRREEKGAIRAAETPAGET
jgi:hypothetical protein